MKIAYLTWGETPRNSGVFGSQALGQVLANNAYDRTAKFFFISAIPLIHSGLFREGRSYSKEIKSIQARLQDIPFIKIPIFFPQNFIFSSKRTFNLMHFGSKNYLSKILEEIKPDIVHCRSYHAAYAALKAREKNNFNYKVVFDPRGVWSEEVARRRKFTENGRDHKFLKQLEGYITRASDAVISVSPQMTDYFKSIGARLSSSIYLSAPVQEISQAVEANLVRSKKNAISLIYLGTLDKNSWHRPAELIELAKTISTHRVIDLKIITMSNHSKIIEEFTQHGVKIMEITSVKSTNELIQHLKNSDIAVLSYFKPQTNNERLLSSFVMAVKTAEYLAAGLPILVNKYCGGAADVIREHNIGIAYDPNDFNEINQKSLASLLSPEARDRAISVAKNLFDFEANAQRYFEVYRKITNS